jgi:hypothetical protein
MMAECILAGPVPGKEVEEMKDTDITRRKLCKRRKPSTSGVKKFFMHEFATT